MKLDHCFMKKSINLSCFIFVLHEAYFLCNMNVVFLSGSIGFFFAVQK